MPEPAQQTPPAEAPPPQPLVPLADASPVESEALNRLATSRAWTSRALAAMRLERYDCPASAGRLISLTRDPSWRVRAYAFAVLARRGVVLPAEVLEGERDERVLRAILRGRYEVPLESIDARIANIERSQRPFEAMVALEVLAALDRGGDDAVARDAANKAIRERMDELLGRVVLRMSRTEAGALSPRLAAITGGSDSGRDYRWRDWYRRGKAKPAFEPAAIVPGAPAGERLVPPNKVAELDAAGFIAFEGYLASVADRPMDLALLIDCTASMWRELSDAQSSADDLVEFLGSVTGGVRIAIIGYRDRTDSWETKAWDFTRSIDEARTRLWSLSAEGGGDEPESVFAAMKTALGRFSWLPDARPPAPQPIRALVLVGDAPPHPGEGTLCVELARKAFAPTASWRATRRRTSRRRARSARRRPPKPRKAARSRAARTSASARVRAMAMARAATPTSQPAATGRSRSTRRRRRRRRCARSRATLGFPRSPRPAAAAPKSSRTTTRSSRRSRSSRSRTSTEPSSATSSLRSACCAVDRPPCTQRRHSVGSASPFTSA